MVVLMDRIVTIPLCEDIDLMMDRVVWTNVDERYRYLGGERPATTLKRIGNRVDRPAHLPVDLQPQNAIHLLTVYQYCT